MRIIDLITAKKEEHRLSEEQIQYIVSGYIDGSIPDYQMAAFLMAVRFAGLSAEECWFMTKAMVSFGEVLDFSAIPGVKIDKHSTGGIGDKATLVVVPAAAAGAVCPKMSGRGLGDTGGTVDKLEAIPGFKTDIPIQQFLINVAKTGACICGHSADFAIADQKIYALRNATSTTDSPGLIAASIMSKKILSGADKILLDVKTGSGAFMKNLTEARGLALLCKEIGELAGREVRCVISNMDAPLGRFVGNALEVTEAISALKGEGPEDLKRLCVLLAAHMLNMAGHGSLDECAKSINGVLADGSALGKFIEMAKDAGADTKYIENPELFETAPIKTVINAPESGALGRPNARDVGRAAFILGAGRAAADALIDPAVGVELLKKQGDLVQRGEPVLVLHAADKQTAAEAEAYIKQNLIVSGERAAEKRSSSLVYEIIM